MKALIELVKTNVEARAILIGMVVVSVILGGILFRQHFSRTLTDAG